VRPTPAARTLMDNAQRIRAIFLAMPNLLKLVSAAAVGPVLFILIALISSGGTPILPLRGGTLGIEFWTSSAGVAALSVSSLFCASSVLMLKRSRVGPVAYILALIGMCAALPALGEIVGIRTTALIFLLVVNIIWTVVLSLYFYLSPAVRNYLNKPRS